MARMHRFGEWRRSSGRARLGLALAAVLGAGTVAALAAGAGVVAPPAGAGTPG